MGFIFSFVYAYIMHYVLIKNSNQTLLRKAFRELNYRHPESGYHIPSPSTFLLF